MNLNIFHEFWPGTLDTDFNQKWLPFLLKIITD